MQDSLHIKKETLRRWRQEFARHLREQGIAANATDRAVRGQSKKEWLAVELLERAENHA